MKTSLALIASILLSGFAAHAEKQELVSLKCLGANGLQLSVRSNSKVVKTELGIFEQDFETTKEISVYRKDKLAITRLAIGLKDDSKSYVYDIYLAEVPTKGKTQKLLGVIGSSVHSLIVFPALAAPVTVPVGFWPTTTLSCNILTK